MRLASKKRFCLTDFCLISFLEIDEGVMNGIKGIGLDTAKAVLNAPREMLIEKADLEASTRRIPA